MFSPVEFEVTFTQPGSLGLRLKKHTTTAPVEVYDVQVAVEYLRHRNGIRDAEDFYRA